MPLNHYVTLGRSGLRVSPFCLGAMTFGEDLGANFGASVQESGRMIDRYLALGGNFLDTANFYTRGHSEVILGDHFVHDRAKRDRVVIATKVFNPMGDDPNARGLSRKHITHAIDDSLRRLGTEYVDLYQIHRYDPYTPIEETLEALTDVVKAGKALYVGASSMYAWQFAQMLAWSEREGYSRFVTMQNHYNLVYREEEREMIPLCRAEGIGLIPWSPLARGFLIGNRKAPLEGATTRAKSDAFATKLYYQPDDYAVVDALSALSQARGVPNAQLAHAWVLSRPGISSPIVGATKMSHLEDALAALEVKLSDEEIAALEAPYKPHPVLGLTL